MAKKRSRKKRSRKGRTSKKKKPAKKKKSKTFSFGGLFKSKKKSKSKKESKKRPKKQVKEQPKKVPGQKVKEQKTETRYKIRLNWPGRKRKEKEQIKEKVRLEKVETEKGAEKKPIKKKKKSLEEIHKERLSKLIVADVMSKNPTILHDNDRLSYVVRLFSEKEISGAPVISDHTVVGIITKSDIIKVIGVKDLLSIDSSGLKKLEDYRASDVMRKKVPTVKRYTKISHATKIMNKQEINILTVVDDKRRIIGVISRGDIVKAVSRELLTKEAKERKGRDRGKTKESVSRVETDVDKLLEIVEKEGSINISEVKERLMVPEEKIEEWAKILDEDGLIELFYPAIGTPVLRKKIKDGTQLYVGEEG